jgi:hypothetical protein
MVADLSLLASFRYLWKRGSCYVNVMYISLSIFACFALIIHEPFSRRYWPTDPSLYNHDFSRTALKIMRITVMTNCEVYRRGIF